MVLEVLATHTSLLNYAKAYRTNTDDHEFFICPVLHGGFQDIVHIVFELAPLIPPAGWRPLNPRLCIGMPGTCASVVGGSRQCGVTPGLAPPASYQDCFDQTFLGLLYFCRSCHIHVEFVVICLFFLVVAHNLVAKQ